MISVIIPVYNPGNLFNSCMESVLNQSYRDLEIILVDDGSTDGSEILCDTYKSEDERVKVIHLENGGAAHARNRGLEIATGEYISFIDSDDWIDLNTFEKAVACMQDNECDIVMYGMQIERAYTDHTDIKKMSVGKDYIELPTRIANNFAELFASDYLSSSCTKLFKRSIIVEQGIWFDETLVMYEDLSFVLAYLTNVRLAYIVRDTFYHYRMDTSVVAVTKRKTDDLLLNIEKVVCNIIKFLDTVGGERNEKMNGVIIQLYMIYLHKIFVEHLGVVQAICEIRRMLKQNELNIALQDDHELVGKGKFYKLLDFALKNHFAILIYAIYKKRY